VKRSLLTPRWLLVHLLFVAAVIATGFLAVWQWDRAHEAGGTFQNLGYSLQWPLFGGFTVFLWYRVVRMRLEQGDGDTADTSGESAVSETQTTVTGRLLVPPPAAPVSEDEDPELAAYNKYLADLNETDRAS
jgi:DNA-binding transcriptional regulator of glucitol operon